METSSLGILTVVGALLGFALFFGSLFFRTPDAPPVASFNLKHWTPIWKQRSQFRSPGYKMMVGGLALFCISFVTKWVFVGWSVW